MYNKTCLCGTKFIGTGPAAKYCKSCAEQNRLRQNEIRRIQMANYRAEHGLIKMPGVGKGGYPHKGKDNPRYKHGKYVFETLRTEIKEDRRYCERCNKDLLEATHYLWVVHHKDHNHWNHESTNLGLLCKQCHQIEHECWKAFTKAQRLGRKAVDSSESKCVDS